MIDAVNVVDIIVYQRYWDNKISVSFGHYQKRVGTWLRNLKKKENGFLVSLFYVVSNENSIYHYPHCPIGSDSCCKYNAATANL